MLYFEYQGGHCSVIIPLLLTYGPGLLGKSVYLIEISVETWI